MNGCNDFEKRGWAAMGIEDYVYNHVNDECTKNVKLVFPDDDDDFGRGFKILKMVLNELYTKLEQIHDGKSSEYRMYAINMCDDELTKKMNKLTKLMYGSLSPYWKYNSILTKEKLIRGDINENR